MRALSSGLVFAIATFGANAKSNFFESFQKFSWIESQDERYLGSSIEVSSAGAANAHDNSLRIVTPSKHYGLSKVLDSPVSPGHPDGFVLQYEVKFSNPIVCSGSYLKLLVADEAFDGVSLKESTPFTIMFGPDICGGTSKVHLIFRAENPMSGEFEEKHMATVVSPFKDTKSHLYTLELRQSDNSFVVKIDGETKATGHLTSDSDFLPAFTPPKEIDDANDKKPDDWVDDKTILDPEDVKPDGWDDIPAEISDPGASQPEDWSEDDDGVWEPPIISNVEYKGPWTQKRITNPDYIGIWKPRLIPNSAYFEDSNPLGALKDIGAVAIEILANDAGIWFSSIMIGNNIKEASDHASDVFSVKLKAEAARDAEEKRLANEERLANLLEEGSFFTSIPVYIEYAFQPILRMFNDSIGSAIGFIVMLVSSFAFLIVRWRSANAVKPSKAVSHKKDDDAAMEEDDCIDSDEKINENESGDEAEEESESDENMESKPTLRKKTK